MVDFQVVNCYQVWPSASNPHPSFITSIRNKFYYLIDFDYTVKAQTIPCQCNLIDRCSNNTVQIKPAFPLRNEAY